ncbi:amino acid adenylation domain-containing protein [Kitasatospora sp. NBC_01250]|uniref:non-ribosomal peptide synthetase n=1 Tax=Kitasatospora sp. NBC_01250 TaxID=2903571 RepID=UPI002E332B10|nr:non-ribosomal peptide synthetase [Kitasatospora sp. NBC_01250]
MTEQQPHPAAPLSAAEKRRLVAARLAGRSGAGGQAPQGPTVFPLGAQQRGIWFAEQASPGRCAYHICRSITLEGPLRVDELRSALTDLTERHEALRTSFAVRDGVPLQRVAPAAEVHLPVQQLPEDDPATVRRIVQAEAEHAFDLTTGPLLRCRLLRRAPERHQLILTLHHIVADGWTVGRLLRDLGELYAARCRGEAPRLPPAPGYSGHALAHRGWLAGPQAARSLGHWVERTRDVPLLELPTDRPRLARAGRRGALVPLALPAEALRGPGDGGAGGTAFPAVLTAWATVLHRWTGQHDFALGVPVAGRTGADWWQSAGLFADFQPLRVDLGGDPSFATATERTRQALLAGLDHPGIPFDRLVEELRPARLPGRNPVFDVACTMLSGHREELVLPGLDTSVERVYAGGAKLDLTLELVQRPDGSAGGHLEYDRDLFDDATAHRLADHLLRVSRAAAEQPHTALSALEVLDAAERGELIRLGTPPHADYPQEATVAELFRRTAARRGDQLALAWAESAEPGAPGSLSYRELDAWSDAAAAALARHGVRRGEFVGVAGGRSVRFVVAVLGILKCGAAYVPLDLTQPAERTALLIEQAGLGLVLDSGTGEPASGPGIPVLALPDPTDGGRPPALRGGPLDPAYLMFTSGSTGVPKGVAVPNRAVVRLVRGGRFAAMTEQTRWLALAPPEFDASTLELWAPLLAGGVLLIGPPGVPDLQGLGALIERSGTTSLWLTAGLFHAMAEENPQGLRPLRQLLAGGDVLAPRQVRAALAAVDGPVVNGYGPTENTTFTTCQVLRTPEEVTDPVPIGRPVEGSTVHLVDAHGNLVPRGAVGELWTGGDGVALGYLGHPARTAERFVPDPFDPRPGRRLYRTGDRARWRADGTLEFLGRADGQVKLRGFRIEPGEVENALTEHPRAAQAAVAVRPLPSGDKHLIAWVVPAEATDADDALAAELRAWLLGRLPAHLVPGRVVLVDRLPLGPTGKVDRRALVDPARDTGDTAAGEEPRPGTEELLATLFAQVLGVTQVGRLADFFLLGGHSLAAIRLIGRIRSWFGVELPVSTVFAAPSVAGLAVAVEAARAAGPVTVPAVTAGGAELGPLSHAQERLWAVHLKDPADVAYTVPLELELTGPLAPAALAAALQAVVDRHPALRTAVDAAGDEPRQRILPPGLPVPLERADLGALAGRAGELAYRDLRAEFVARPFDLTRAPLLRALLITTGPDRARLLLTVHHLVVDGAGVAVLLRDLARACDTAGALPPAAAATPTGIDLALAERRLLAGPAREELTGHWRRRLAGLHRPAAAGDASPGELLRVEVPAATVAALRERAAGAGATLHMAVTAAAGLLLAEEHAGEVVLGAPMAQRLDEGFESEIGLFLTTVPLRLSLDGGPAFGEALVQVRRTLLDAARHAALPYEQIAELVRDEAGQVPQLIDAMVQVQPALPARLAFGGAQAVLRPAHHGTAKFDLTLSLFDDGTRLTGFWEFATATRTAAEVGRLHERLLALLAAAGADLTARPSDAAAPEDAVAGATGAAPQAATAPADAADPAMVATVAEIWQELLGTRPGPSDSFFALGGSSISATRVVSRLRVRTGRAVALRELYDWPRLAEFAARVAGAPAAGHRPALTRGEAEHGPLSFAQLRHWVLDRLDPGTAANNIPLALRLSGPLDRSALAQALALVASRQGALRTVFADHDGVPEQRLLPPVPVELPVTEVAGEAAALAAADEQAALPFELTAGPPWRAALLRLTEQEHWLLLTFHHIIADGWSTSVLLGELAAAYAVLCEEPGAVLPPAPPVRYLDHARRQREWLSGEQLQAELAPWQRLRGTPPLELPPPAQAGPGGVGSIALSLPARWRREAELLAGQERASLYMLLLALWAATLELHTGQQDFAVGTFSAGRTEPALEQLVGFFVNNLALRCELAGDPSWRERIARARATCTEAFAHQEVPFEKVLEAAGVERSTERTPLFQTLCVLQNYPGWPQQLGRLGLDLVRRPYDRADFALTLWLRPDEDGGLSGGIDHDTAAVDEATAGRIAQTFRRFAEAVLAGPDARPRRALPAAPAVRPALAPAAGPWLHQRTAATAARTPDAPALIEYRPADGSTVVTTHGELDQAANRLAHRLRQAGIGPERAVAVLLGRSAQAVTAFLAVLKAGGGYVPIDPGYPPERIRTLLEDSGADLVLGGTEQLARLTADGGSGPLRAAGPTLALDDPATVRELAALPAHAPEELPTAADQLAYAIFTSGSTGRPKAVAVSHANLTGYLEAIGPRLALRPGDRVLGFASVSFDATVEELYPALVAGASVVLRPDGLRTPDSGFDAFLAATRPTVLSLPVSFWHAWVERMTAERLRVPGGVHTLLLNAEAPAPARYQDWLRLCDAPVRWINTYGPTEATVTATLHQPAADGTAPPLRFPIGTALANTTLHVLDGYGTPVPPGTPGELFLGGLGIARGYLGRPAATARAYPPDPYGAEPGARLYRTGDRVRQLPSGELEFLGRLDHQLKIRGHRVEPGEVEAALAGHPAVRQCAVLPHGAPPALRLVAYVAPAGDAANEQEIRRDLGDRLPEHLVPARILFLERLPLTPNAKVDRAALAARLAEDLRAAEQDAPAAELTERQRLLAGVWREVLGRERIGPEDNFFALGGDSLLAVQLAVRARAVGLALEAREVFRHQSLAEQAEAAQPLEAAQQSTDRAVGPSASATRLDGHEKAALMARLNGR